MKKFFEEEKIGSNFNKLQFNMLSIESVFVM